MNSNVTLKSNIYINKTGSRDDWDFLQHITDFRVLKRYAGNNVDCQRKWKATKLSTKMLPCELLNKNKLLLRIRMHVFGSMPAPAQARRIRSFKG